MVDIYLDFKKLFYTPKLSGKVLTIL